MHDRVRVADGEEGGGGWKYVRAHVPDLQHTQSHLYCFFFFFALQRLNGYVVALERYLLAPVAIMRQMIKRMGRGVIDTLARR